MLTNDFLNILACPVCKGELNTSDNSKKLLCHTCGNAFPIRDGIPVMLADEHIKD